MKKKIRLTENDLIKIIDKVINEQMSDDIYDLEKMDYRDLNELAGEVGWMLKNSDPEFAREIVRLVKKYRTERNPTPLYRVPRKGGF